MLVLSRQREESIILGDDIIVTVLDIRGDKVRLGIQAPDSVSVHRSEVYKDVRREQRAMTGTQATEALTPAELWITRNPPRERQPRPERPLTEREKADLAHAAYEGSQLPPDDEPESQVVPPEIEAETAQASAAEAVLTQRVLGEEQQAK